MKEISELIYETCKTYLITQGKFIMILWIFIAIIVVAYFGILRPVPGKPIFVTLPMILLFSLGRHRRQLWRRLVRHSREHLREFAHCVCQSRRQALSDLCDSAQGRDEHRHAFDQRRVADHAFHSAVYSGDYAGPCFIGFAIGESLGAAALRIAGGIFTKIADIGSDLMKIVFKIKEDDARNPGVIADCTGGTTRATQVGPSADGFEPTALPGVALITSFCLAVPNPTVQIQLLVWIFVMRIMMLISSAAPISSTAPSPKRGTATPADMNFEAPLTSLGLDYFNRFDRPHLCRLLSDDSGFGRHGTLWWKLATIISAARWPAPSFLSWLKYLPQPNPGTCRKSSSPRRRRRLAGHLVRLCRGKFLSVLAGASASSALMGIRVPHQHAWAWTL
jgi:K(+)-stimulated pyrophosphate-energized sodium pump